MKLLFITRKVDQDDGLAGFTYNWIKSFSANVDRLFVICLEKGNIEGLPDNVQVFSLGKENGKNRWAEFWRWQSLAWRLVPQVDGIFAHQNPEYGILIAPFAKLFHKQLIAWYAHGAVSWRLRLLNFLADKMLTSTLAGFNLPSKKKVVLHQGIDIDLFSFSESRHNKELKLLSVSRIGATKNIEAMIGLVDILKNRLPQPVTLQIIGTPTLKKDEVYLNSLKDKVTALNLGKQVQFLGSVANSQTPRYYQAADFFLNFSDTGSLDKTILEAMSCGTFVISSNQSAQQVLDKRFLVNDKDLLSVSHKIIDLLNMPESDKLALRRELRQEVVSHHSLKQLVADILQQYK